MNRDISDKAGCQKLAQEIASKESALHLLVNNAGIALEEDLKFSNNESLDFSSPTSLSEHLLRATTDIWLDTYKTNTQAVYMLSACLLPLLAKGNDTFKGYTSSIVNITSISGIMKTPSSGQFAYAASKAAALQVTKNLANTFIKTKVRVNSIAVSHVIKPIFFNDTMSNMLSFVLVNYCLYVSLECKCFMSL